MRMIRVNPIYPPPGLNLELPSWTPEEYFLRIGGDCHDYADKFETLQEVFSLDSKEMRAKGVPCKQRKYILRTRELLRCGVLTFEYLGRRTVVGKIREL
mmetsp:Transcript_6408/g.7367  ORF Transcript_6408/g.7367 Transcript_6408/m.7367 type:complete len:99 (+) Transcript_6408:120-416(+)|eukprot:CAMPEP_0168319288 /NCGR_PEP_ID=MMETSP0213-20121227/962_1 /TAXON_ID=151035 /ORGANISM="Euplotes harpa, Strain FSP1.4" /LENGTH=98 /DNA_ID=CAMNT_0008320471 /DNA_START=123 /DNA_END=419 /DNA_ORIENTATION=-